MTPLIAMQGPWLPEEAEDARTQDALPELPALTRLLQRARRLQAAVDWRTGVLAALGSGSDAAPVAVAAKAVPELAQDAPLCFAAPLHVVAGMSRVHLPPGGRLLLDAAEEQAWCAAFNQEFGAGGMRLHIAATGGGWLLAAPFAHSARDDAPETLVGAVLERQPATGPDQRELRRLGAEAEMWLAGHALNRAREARREPPLNAIWFWGGSRAAALPALGAPRIVVNAGSLPDAWLSGLARQTGMEVAVLEEWPEAVSAIDTATAHAGQLLVVLAPDGGGATGQYWQMLEERWFAPAAQALRSGAICGLRLQIGGDAFALPNRSLAALLRWQHRSWWQRCGQVRP